MVAVGASAEEVADALQAGVDHDAALMADAFCNANRLVFPGDDPSPDDEVDCWRRIARRRLRNPRSTPSLPPSSCYP
jgi:hypothetical protein